MSGELKTRGLEQNRKYEEEYTEVNTGIEDFADEVEENQEIIVPIEAEDSDTQQSVEQAKQAATEIATEKTEELEGQKDNIDEDVRELSSEMREHGEKERENVGTASGMSGNFESVGSALSSSFQESAEEFESIAQEGDEMIESAASRFGTAKDRATVPF